MNTASSSSSFTFLQCRICRPALHEWIICMHACMAHASTNIAPRLQVSVGAHAHAQGFSKAWWQLHEAKACAVWKCTCTHALTPSPRRRPASQTLSFGTCAGGQVCCCCRVLLDLTGPALGLLPLQKLLRTLHAAESGPCAAAEAACGLSCATQEQWRWHHLLSADWGHVLPETGQPAQAGASGGLCLPVFHAEPARQQKVQHYSM